MTGDWLLMFFSSVIGFISQIGHRHVIQLSNDLTFDK